MAESVLKLLIHFRKVENEIHFVKREAKNFFEEYNNEKNLSCSVSIGSAKSIDVDLIYKADLHEIEVVLEYRDCKPNFHSGNQFKMIGKNWCNSTKNKLAHLWLKLANRSILKNGAKQFHSDVDVKEIAFGTAPSMQYFMQHYHYESFSLEKEIMATFLHNQRHFIIYTCLNHSSENCRNQCQTHKFKVFYKSLTKVIMNDDHEKDVFQIYFFMRHIPLVYREKKGRNNDEEDEKKSSHRAQFLASDQEYQERKWERSTTFGCMCNRSHCKITKVGKCPVFKVVIPKTRAFGIMERLIQRCAPSTSFFFSNFQTTCSSNLENFQIFPYNVLYFRSLINQQAVADIKFLCQYAWEVVHGRSLEIRDQIVLKNVLNKGSEKIDHWEFIKQKIGNAVKYKEALISALYHISDMIMRHDIFVFEEAFQKLFDYYRLNPVKIELPEGMCLVRRLIITPSRILCVQPTEHFDNRIIREFKSEHMLRVSIQDDDFSKLTFAVQYHTRKEEFMQPIKDMLIRGVQIGPREYDVLASSNSQLREHGLWMYSRDGNGNTASKIRAWMGDFSQIRNVAKYMARLGQCFSTSEEAVQIELEEDEVIGLEDIKGKDYVFSDGVGMISTKLAQEVRDAFKEKVPMKILDDGKPLYDPRAFQIRFKGCKGMVAENPHLTGRKLGKRPSMEKFQCDNSSVLEIVKISAPRSLFLNRPLISILEQLGIPETVFMKLQKEMVFDMTDSLIYERKAHKMLANRTGLDYPYKRLLKSGICLTQEPFFRRLLLSVYTVGIDLLRSKARIAIPPEFGRNMLGVIDETKTLNYGQIFVQYSEEIGNDLSRTKVLSGTVVVTKNPCMHPGDVRKLEAVDVPALHHIKDCIVFPAKGPRPHPDEMAGSDLDGDEYVVIWLEDLIFERKHHEAMDYPPNPETRHSGSITVPDMINFLCTYIQNDNVGVMANAYLAWADYVGIFSKVCASIAQKYPRALDFAKSGTTEYLTSKEKPKLYPDFMEKGSANNSYKSKRALGFLYRVTRTLEACISRVDLANITVSIDENLEYSGWEHYKDSAEYSRSEYVKRIKNILKKYGLQNETEALSGYVSKLNEYSENRYERDNALSVARTYIKDTIKRYRYEFYKSYDNECVNQRVHRSEILEVKYRRASAWYMVTYRHSDKSILSFPWVIADVLCELRDKNLKSKGVPVVPKSSFIQSSDVELLNIFSNTLAIKHCQCCVILRKFVSNWMKKCSLILTMVGEESFCTYCFERIIDTFVTNTRKTCCSVANDGNCECKDSCSPTKLLLNFMKFYATEVVSHIGDCTESNICQGFRDLNLQSLSLQTYATMAVTRNIHYRNASEDCAESDIGGDCREGDPIRITVIKNFENVITHHKERLYDLLKALSGVQEIFMNCDKDNQGNWYILVHSIGKPFQQWALEELIMDDNMPNLVRRKLKITT